MDLLDSIMSKMDRPPVISTQQKKLLKEQQKAAEEAKAKEREALKNFRKKVKHLVYNYITLKMILLDRRYGEYNNEFFQDSTRLKMPFEPMDRVGRSIVRDVADVAGLTTHVFGLEEDERWVMAFKKEYPLSEDELNAYRNGVDWDPDKAKEDALQRERQKKEEEERAKKLRKEPVPNKFLEKYERLVGKESGLKAARVLEANNKQFGFVSSEMKKDKRTIEETLADIKRAKKSKMSQETAKD
ncbi:Sperm-associated antigen 7 [Armadillidium nasatum]|uniref:Sperm-associated antigen 7 n=1 Tax=Armadillidium nasatum TaxID=96803 RepID=A0A5N5TP58_9CRUS|nr:Sperm-associated antigen 7 [Armadillidium nasatum]